MARHQDKATTEKFAKILREMIKRPENKVCADCKRNDPRWASWNIGVFLCIRCSGTHRGMGTHISKVKSVDLDVWTPEQMESIQKWGNYRANLYWEARLKPGHIPPEHKMESFIRSKYESRRWALEGPPPADPSVLENGSSAAPSQQPQAQQETPPSASTSSRSAQAPSNTLSGPSLAPTAASRQPAAHQLISANYTNTQRQMPTNPTMQQTATQPAALQPAQPSIANDIFNLDFRAPPVESPAAGMASEEPPKKDVKQDILSLFSTPSPATQVAAPFGQFGYQQSPWAGVPTQQQPVAQMQMPVQTSMIGNSGAGAWGVSSGWTGAPTATTIPATQANVWGGMATTTSAQPLPQHQGSLFNTSDIWGGSTATTTPQTQGLFATPAATQAQKDDVFGDIWGGFK